LTAAAFLKLQRKFIIHLEYVKLKRHFGVDVEKLFTSRSRISSVLDYHFSGGISSTIHHRFG
jgi:hypothetical protein